MRGLTAATLVFVLFGMVHSSHNHLARNRFRNTRDLPRDKVIAKRQQDSCTVSNYPSSCPASLDIDSTSDPESFFDSQEFLNLLASPDLANVLDAFCTSECTQPIVDFLKCLELPATKFTELLCGKSGNQYCLVIFVGDSTIGEGIDCVEPGETCDASCETAQETVVAQWGCCAATYYDYVEATCNVNAGDPCEAMVDDGMGDDGMGDDATVGGGIINKVGLGLITIFAIVAAVANAVLF